MTRQRSVLLVSDLPFWLRRTGAEQRVAGCARYLRQTSRRFGIYFLGTDTSASQLTGKWAREVKCFQPLRWWQRIGSQPRSVIRAGAATADRSLRLSDYQWPEAIRQFRRLVKRTQPDVIVFEYITMSYLARSLRDDPLPRQTRPILCLDSHDVLHRRCEQFNDAGHRHWLQVTEAEERAAIEPFDVVMAIQPDEANWFRAQRPDLHVPVVGHGFDFAELQQSPARIGNHVVLGYFGSNNASNVDAVRSFYNDAWPEIRSHAPQAEWLIGGTVVDDHSVGRLEIETGIRCVRDFASPSDFYRQIDIAINPVRFGTGLKIKNVEALAHGRPLVTTTAGLLGIPEPFGDSCQAADTVASMVRAILNWIEQPQTRAQDAERAARVARTELTDEAVFADWEAAVAAVSADGIRMARP